jgi:hypothetical protein
LRLPARRPKMMPVPSNLTAFNKPKGGPNDRITMPYVPPTNPTHHIILAVTENIHGDHKI